MTAIDLDQMRSRWQQQSARVDEKLNLDIEAVRATLAARTTSAFRTHARWLIVALGCDALVLISLVAFIVGHSHDWMYLLVATSIGMIVLGETVADLHEWRTINRLDSSAPLTTTQETFEDLRARRLRMTRWILLLSVLMWWPLLALAFKGLLGVDLLRAMHWSVAAVNLAVGLAFIPFASVVVTWLSRRFANSTAFQQLLDDMAGRSFDAARQTVRSRARFESDIVDGASANAIGAVLGTPIWPDAARAPLRSLQLRLLLGILFYASLLIATGVFNASNGGFAQFLVPGLLLNFLWVALMLSGIAHRVQLPRIAVSRSLPVAIESLAQVVAWRVTIARYALIATPLLSLAAMQVAAKLLIDVELWTLLGPAVSLGAISISIAIAASLAMLFRRRRAPQTFAPKLVDALCFGAIGATHDLIAALRERNAPD